MKLYILQVKHTNNDKENTIKIAEYLNDNGYNTILVPNSNIDCKSCYDIHVTKKDNSNFSQKDEELMKILEAIINPSIFDYKESFLKKNNLIKKYMKSDKESVIVFKRKYLKNIFLITLPFSITILTTVIIEPNNYDIIKLGIITGSILLLFNTIAFFLPSIVNREEQIKKLEKEINFINEVIKIEKNINIK